MIILRGSKAQHLTAYKFSMASMQTFSNVSIWKPFTYFRLQGLS